MSAFRAAWPCVFLSFAGCYFQYPHDLSRKPPPRVANAKIELHDEDNHYFDPCPEYADGCFIRHGKLVREIHYTTTTATYDGKPITRGQVSALAEPERQAKAYAEMEKHLPACRYSLAPSVVFAAGAIADLAGLVVYQASSNDSVKNIGSTMLISGAIAMVAGAALSYPIGGYACNRGEDAAHAGMISSDNAIMWVTGSTQGDHDRIERERELRVAVESFNQGSGQVAHDDSPAAPEPTPAPASAAKTVDGTLRDALAADGRFAIFLKLVDHAGVDELTRGEHLLVFAPTDDVFTSAPNFDLDKLLAAKSKNQRRKLRDELLGYIVDDAASIDEAVAHSRGHLRLRRKGGAVTADGYPVLDPAIAARNGTLYPLGPKP